MLQSRSLGLLRRLYPRFVWWFVSGPEAGGRGGLGLGVTPPPPIFLGFRWYHINKQCTCTIKGHFFGALCNILIGLKWEMFCPPFSSLAMGLLGPLARNDLTFSKLVIPLLHKLTPREVNYMISFLFPTYLLIWIGYVSWINSCLTGQPNSCK